MRKCENGEMLDSPALDFTTERTDASGVIHENATRFGAAAICEARLQMRCVMTHTVRPKLSPPSSKKNLAHDVPCLLSLGLAPCCVFV